MLLGLVLANFHVFTEFKDSEISQNFAFFIHAALLWDLEPQGFLYIFMPIDIHMLYFN